MLGATVSRAGGEISFQFLSVTCILGSHQNNETGRDDSLRSSDDNNLQEVFLFHNSYVTGSSDFFMDIGT